VVLGSRDDRVLRMVPRYNPDVNDHWMCDAGRLHSAFVNDPERLAAPQVGGKGAPYPVAIQRAADLLDGARGAGILAVASPFMTNEELFALAGLLDALGVEDRWFLRPTGEADDLLVHPEKCPNARGCALAGFTEAPADLPDREWGALLYVVPREGADLPDELLRKAKRKILFSLKPRAADVCFPLTTWIEKDGTVVSAGDRVQRISKGITYEPTLVTERTVLDRLLAAARPDHRPADTAAQAFARLAAENPAFAGLTWKRIGLQGAPLQAQESPA
jgi:NADH-quinone oxidoreductase subunit G